MALFQLYKHIIYSRPLSFSVALISSSFYLETDMLQLIGLLNHNNVLDVP